MRIVSPPTINHMRVTHILWVTSKKKGKRKMTLTEIMYAQAIPMTINPQILGIQNGPGFTYLRAVRM